MPHSVIYTTNSPTSNSPSPNFSPRRCLRNFKILLKSTADYTDNKTGSYYSHRCNYLQPINSHSETQPSLFSGEDSKYKTKFHWTNC
jgi:hypothetical protein